MLIIKVLNSFEIKLQSYHAKIILIKIATKGWQNGVCPGKGLYHLHSVYNLRGISVKSHKLLNLSAYLSHIQAECGKFKQQYIRVIQCILAMAVSVWLIQHLLLLKVWSQMLENGQPQSLMTHYIKATIGNFSNHDLHCFK